MPGPGKADRAKPRRTKVRQASKGLPHPRADWAVSRLAPGHKAGRFLAFAMRGIAPLRRTPHSTVPCTKKAGASLPRPVLIVSLKSEKQLSQCDRNADQTGSCEDGT